MKVPPFLPDTPEVREDLLDYLFEIRWFDQQLSQNGNASDSDAITSLGSWSHGSTQCINDDDSHHYNDCTVNDWRRSIQ